ncbi:8371_t:CDS:1, partial [Diversispora eburnea]
MSNDQLTINTLRELNSRFASEITELRKENAEIPELRKKFSE